MTTKPYKRSARWDDAFFAHDGRLPAEAEDLAEEFIATATSAEEVFTNAADELTVEELGGPFLEIDARRESAWFGSSGDDET